MIAARAGGAEPSAVTFSGESRATALRLAEAHKRLEEKKWPEAIEELQAIVNSAGNDLIGLTATQSVRATRLCQIQLASLPPEALRLYRRRYETQARKKLEQAQTVQDIHQLRKIVDEAFCTKAAEKALDQLGDRAFERGHFEEAEEWWRLLSPLPDARRDPATRGFALVYPDLSLDPARLQAKQLLARLFGEPGSAWLTALAGFRARYGEVEGTLAGRKGRYADLLQALADERKKGGPAADTDWPTFGGAPSRGRRLPAPDDILDRLSALCRAGPTWRFNLEVRGQQEGPVLVPAVNAAQARSFAFHPAIVGHQILAADAQFVTAYDLRTGKSREWYDVAAVNGGVKPNLSLPAPPDLRYTLTVADENVYVRLGAQDLGREAPRPAPLLGQVPKPGRDNETFLACLGLRPDGQGNHLRWTLRGIVRDNALFEGAPLVADGQIYIASLRYAGGRCITSLDAYPAEDTSEPPLRWRREMCSVSDESKPGEARYRHHLLARAGTQLVYCSHTGAIVAVDALTGRTNWAVRYPRRIADKDRAGQFAANAWKDLAPALFADGRLYIAPADSDRLLCLDPASGRTLWEREAMKVVHLLGVGQERLIFSTVEGLRAVGAADGSDAAGWMVPDAGGPRAPMGRGLLIGDLVLWPTVRPGDLSTPSGVEVVRQSDGRPAGDPSLLHRLPAGNLVYANGCLAVADRQTLSVFVPPQMLLREKKTETRRPADPVPALLEAARKAARAKRWPDADTALRQAAAAPPTPRGRLHALVRAAQIWQDVGQTARALAVWETILADETLRQLQVIDKNGTPGSASAYARSAVARLRGEQPPMHSRAPPPERGATEVAELALPLFRTWYETLERDEWVLDGWQQTPPEHLLTGSPQGRLLCRSSTNGELRWQHSLPFAPRWAGGYADTVLAGGERGVAGIRRKDGERLWHFPAPASGRYPSAALEGVRVIQDPQTPEPLTGFRQVAGRLFFLQGQRRLFALDAETGAVLWHRWAPDGGFHLPHPQGCFSSCYCAGAKTVLLQAAGRRWLLDAATGRPIHESPDSQELWQRPPLELDEHSWCVVPDRRHVLLLDVLTGAVRWTHTLTGGTTLSGEMPHVLGRGEVLLLATPANVGYFLQRLDRVSGKPLWPQSRLLTLKSLDLSLGAFDRETVYIAEDRQLTARSLADGRVLWERPLDGEAAWQVERRGDYLLVYPAPSPGEARFWFRSPLGSVQWNVARALKPETVFAVQCRAPKTGQLVQRLNFRIEAPARMTFQRRRIPGERGRFWLVQTSPLLANADGPVVRLGSRLPFVAVGGEVWGLRMSAEVLDAERR